MIKKLYSVFNPFFIKKIDGIGLDLFRIAYFIVLFLEVHQMYEFRHLIFDKTPYLEPYEINMGIPIVTWMFVIINMIIGFKTKFFSILNYLFTLMLLGSIQNFEYHVFYAYLGINFLLMFIPVDKCFSIDRIITKLKYSNTKFLYKPENKVLQFYYFIIPFVALGLVYFDSIFHKITSPMWRQGLGVWLPSSMPFSSIQYNSMILNQEWIMYALGYLTLLFEFLFIFLFFRRKTRLIMFLIGIGLHLGILLTFPIPWFALTAISVYILMIPVSFWRKLQYKVKNPGLKFFYDNECPLCVRTKIIINSLDWFGNIEFEPVQSAFYNTPYLEKQGLQKALDNIYSEDRKGNFYQGYNTYLQVFKRIIVFWPLYVLGNLPIFKQIGKRIYSYIAKHREVERCTEENCGYNPPAVKNSDDFKILHNLKLGEIKKMGFMGLVILICLLSANAIFISPLSKNVKDKIGWNEIPVSSKIYSFNKTVLHYSKTLFGITTHDVFMDGHFRNYNHIIQIAYINKAGEEEVLPLIDDSGSPTGYNSGFNWAYYTFRVSSGKINQDVLNKGLKNWTAYWAYQNQVDLNDAKFKIKVKKVQIPKQWESNYLDKQRSQPWIDAGEVIWKDKEFESRLKDIESL